MYNGNISSIRWQSKGDQLKKGYAYTYDGANRLTSATYKAYDGANAVWNIAVDAYSVKDLTYDENGNILSLNRYGLTDFTFGTFGLMDQLTYDYEGNQLVKVEDAVGVYTNDFSDDVSATTEYLYDHSGNMTDDDNKGIDLAYNHLNLLTNVVSPNSQSAGSGNSLVFKYDAIGRKLAKAHYEDASPTTNTPVTWTYYLGEFQYTQNASGTTLDFVMLDDGRLTPDGAGGFQVEYHIKDHLGSLRMAFSDLNNDQSITASSEIIQEGNHYPFGLEHRYASGSQPSQVGDKHPYGYTGMELQGEFGLYYNDHGARMSDPQLGRWFGVDPLAHAEPGWSPYRAFFCNPINFTDPTGLLESPIYDNDLNFLGTDDEGLQGDAIIMDKDNFTQGMSHEDAMSKGHTLDNMPMDQALEFANNGNFLSFLSHYKNLPNRIDYSPDFVLTKEIADKHWQGGTGEGLFVNQANIDLPGVTTTSFDNKAGSSFYKNFVWGMSNTGKVYGTLKLTLQNASSGTVHIGGSKFLDEYDFSTDGRPLRDFATWWGRPGEANDGKSYFIYGYGKATVPVKN